MISDPSAARDLRLPVRLGKQPLIESILEVRLPQGDQTITDLLPGLAFAKLEGQFSRSEVLPLASIPREIRERDPNLQFKGVHRLVGEDSALTIGDRVVGLSRLAPYGGWEDFRGRIDRFIEVVEGSGLANRIIRYSMKSLNVIPPFTERQLEMVRLQAVLGDQTLPDKGFNLRTELNDKKYVRIIEITPGVTITPRTGREVSGLRLDIDCICNLAGPSPWQTLKDGIEKLHTEAKLLFFSILTNETLQRLEPKYE